MPASLAIDQRATLPLAQRLTLRRLSHLCQPARRLNPRLLINSRQQRRQCRHNIPDRAHAIVRGARTVARVPARDLRLQSVDGGSVRHGEFFVRVVFEHHVLQQSMRTAEDVGHLPVGFGHLGHGLGFFLFGEE